MNNLQKSILILGSSTALLYACSRQEPVSTLSPVESQSAVRVEDVIAENDSNIQSIDKLIDEGYALVMWDRMEVHTKARLTAQGWYEVLDDEAKTYLVDNPRKNKKDKQLNQEASPPIIDSPTQTSLIGRFDSFSRSMNDFAKQYTPVGKLEKTFVYDIGKRIYDGMQWYIFGRDMEQIEREQTQKKAQAESQEKNK